MAMDASTGRVSWKHEWPTNTLASSPLEYASGTVLVGIGQALCALDAATGDPQWQVALDGQVARLAAEGDVAYAAIGLQTGGGLSAIQL
jgi:outer membrane protein assembly factor BamB